MNNVLDVLGKINNPETTISEIESDLVKDVALTYKLMRFVNSPNYKTKVTIGSVKQALVLIGQRELRVWISLILLSGRDDMPSVYSELLLFRAKFCELLAEKADMRGRDIYFTVGLFSGLDMVMGTSLETILDKLPLSQEVRYALLDGQGELGEALSCAKSYESGDLDMVKFKDIDDEDIGQAFEESVAWSYSVMSCF